MVGITIWLLVTVSAGRQNAGNVAVLERFTSVEQCEFVRKAIPQSEAPQIHWTRCIQATVVKP